MKNILLTLMLAGCVVEGPGYYMHNSSHLEDHVAKIRNIPLDQMPTPPRDPWLAELQNSGKRYGPPRLLGRLEDLTLTKNPLCCGLENFETTIGDVAFFAFLYIAAVPLEEIFPAPYQSGDRGKNWTSYFEIKKDQKAFHQLKKNLKKWASKNDYSY